MEPDSALADAQDDACLPGSFSCGCPLQTVELSRGHQDITIGVVPVYSEHMTVKIICEDLEFTQDQLPMLLPFRESHLGCYPEYRSLSKSRTQREGQDLLLLITNTPILWPIIWVPVNWVRICQTEFNN